MSVWHTLIAVDNSGAEGVGVRWGPFSTVKLFLYIENISIIFAAIIFAVCFSTKYSHVYFTVFKGCCIS